MTVARTEHPDATFSNAFGINRNGSEDWFDPKLHTDTDLFIDPFLMFEESSTPWNAIHDRLIDFFNTAMEHVARSDGNHHSVEWKRAAAMFSFPEPPEFCLGYGVRTIFGSGSSKGLGTAMLAAAERAIAAGVRNIDDFGELMLFGAGFGADRISDMVCNVVKDDFVRYTAGVAKRHRVPSDALLLRHYRFDFQRDRWNGQQVHLPLNPCWAKRTGVLLTPKRFLSELPKMDDGAFWNWVYSNENEQLREDLGYEITRGLDKKEIIELARRRVRLRSKYGVLYASAFRESPPRPYDFRVDPGFKMKPIYGAQEIAKEAVLAAPETAEDFCEFVAGLTDHFKWSVEDRSIWKAFWADGKALDEPRAQDLFHLAVLLTCKERRIDLTPEANAGPGPVDFKFSAGWAQRALVELKFAKSRSFWDNLELQTPTYMKAEGQTCGFIVVIQHEARHCSDEFVDRVKRILERIQSELGISYRPVFVDVRPRPSASKRRRRG